MADQLPDDHPPEGYVLAARRGPFTTHNGPLYLREEEGSFVQGIRLRDRHCNGAAIVHGGMLLTFVDGVMGVMAFRETGTLCVTIRMVSDFLSPARAGEWLDGRGVVTRVEDGFAFCEGMLYVGHRDVLKASGVFKLMHRKRDGD